jgi:kynureninase
MTAERTFSQEKDRHDALAHYRDKFFIPQKNGKDVAYFCGNSLGLQPKSCEKYLSEELETWRNFGVEGHAKGKRAWFQYHKNFLSHTAQLVGALENEVAVMNTLTVNLHLLMVSFYRPTQSRFVVLMEGGAFPSDQYAVESQVKFHGFAPETAIKELFPREGEFTLRTEDILQAIDNEGDKLALVLFGGVNYYTGQLFDMQKITQKAHEKGAFAGFDLAHAAGNVLLKLHEWGTDFAVWCSYKYLNSGPGGVSGAFIHEKHVGNADIPRFAGWWGHDEEQRFLMKKGFIPMKNAGAWQLSNAQVLPMSAHLASLDIFAEAGMAALRQKSLELTASLEFLLQTFAAEQEKISLQIITPKTAGERGCQLSIFVKNEAKKLFRHLTENGIIGDFREPNVIRLAPVPLYNRFEDCFEVYEALKSF